MKVIGFYKFSVIIYIIIQVGLIKTGFVLKIQK